MGEVLAGHDEKLDRPVAIKRIRADLSLSEQRRQRLETEARLNARLSHTNVVQVYDFVTSDGLDHIVTEYVDGKSLAETCREEQPSLQRSLEHLLAIARGLDAAHRQGIIHRDLKRENVLITRDGQTKIADFGIAILRDGRADSERPAGTPAAMAPEQRVGGSVDARSDLYSLGVLAYELLSGTSLTSVLETGVRRPLVEIVPTLPVELSRLVDRLLETERELRPSSALEVEAELRAIAARNERIDASPGEARVQLRQIAALSLRLPIATARIEEIAAGIAKWQQRLREIATRYRAHLLLQPSGLEALLCVGYPRIHGDNAVVAATIFAELDGVAGGIDVGRVAVLDQAGTPIVAGPPIEGAAVACRLASPGAVNVTPTAHRTLSRSFRLSPIGADASEGRQAVLYRLEEPLDWEARGALVSSPFVGREDTLALLHEAETRVFNHGSDRANGIVIVGPPGAGKSRLVRAFVNETSAARVVFVRAAEQTRATAFAAFARLLHELPELRGTREAVAACIDDLPSRSPEMIAAVAKIAGVQSAEDDAILARAASYEQHAFLADHLARFLVELLAPHTSVVVVEDLFWLDTSSLDVVRLLAAQARGHQLLIYCTSRPAPLLRHLPERLFVQHELKPLAMNDAARLADAAAGGWVLPPRVARALIDRAAGIPLVLEELTQFVAARAVSGGSGTSAFDLQSIPTTFSDAILERFQDLGGQTRRVAQLAASIGNEIDESVLAAVADIPADELRSHIELLSREGLLHGTSFGERRMFAFRHALTRDAIYEAQDSATRIASHRSILQKVALLFPEWETERPEIIALQCDGAGDLERSARAWLKAGRRAVATWSAAVAGQHFEAALQVIARAPAGSTWAGPLELEVRKAYGPVLSALMNWASDAVNANNARIRALTTSSDQPIDWSTTFLSLSEDITTGAADVLSAKLGLLAEEFDGSSPMAGVNRYLLESMRAVLSVHAGYLVRAREGIERALVMREGLLPILQTFPVPEPMLLPAMYLTWIHMLEGRVDEAWKLQQAEEARFEKGSMAYVTACGWGAALAMVLHDWEAARWRTEMVLKSEVALHHIVLSEFNMAILQLREYVRTTTPSGTEILRLIDAAARAFIRWRGDPPRMRLCVPLYISYLVEGCLDAARVLTGTEAGADALAKARAWIDELLALADEANILDRYVASETFRLHADLLEIDGKLEEAKRVRKEAKARARSLEMTPGCRVLLEERVDGKSARA